jgi:hypothetical protein
VLIVEIYNFCSSLFDFKVMSVCEILGSHIPLLNAIDGFFVDIALQVVTDEANQARGLLS